MGTVDIDMSVVDALPSDPVFPLPGFPLLTQEDQGDALLNLCAKAVASCGNRALTPKEISLICARKWGWTFR